MDIINPNEATSKPPQPMTRYELKQKTISAATAEEFDSKTHEFYQYVQKTGAKIHNTTYLPDLPHGFTAIISYLSPLAADDNSQ